MCPNPWHECLVLGEKNRILLFSCSTLTRHSEFWYRCVSVCVLLNELSCALNSAVAVCFLRPSENCCPIVLPAMGVIVWARHRVRRFEAKKEKTKSGRWIGRMIHGTTKRFHSIKTGIQTRNRQLNINSKIWSKAKLKHTPLSFSYGVCHCTQIG